MKRRERKRERGDITKEKKSVEENLKAVHSLTFDLQRLYIVGFSHVYSSVNCYLTVTAETLNNSVTEVSNKTQHSHTP